MLGTVTSAIISNGLAELVLRSPQSGSPVLQPAAGMVTVFVLGFASDAVGFSFEYIPHLAPSTVQFGNTYKTLLATFSTAVNVASFQSTFQCSELVQTSTLALMGTPSGDEEHQCSWQSDTVLSLPLLERFTLRPGMDFRFIAASVTCQTDPVLSTIGGDPVAVLDAASPPDPVPKVEYHTELGECDSMVLDGGQSTFPGGEGKFTWACTNDDTLNSLLSLKSPAEARVSVDAKELEGGKSYNVVVTVKDFAGRTKSLLLEPITKLSAVPPKVIIEASRP